MSIRITVILLMTGTVFLAVAAMAGVPQLISYQGRLTDDTGTPVQDGSYNLTFSIYEHNPVPMGEDPIWSSGVQAVDVSDGLFTYYLGSSVSLPASVFTDPGWESHYLNVAVEGGALRAVVHMVTVPFAYQSVKSDTAAYAVAGPGSGTTGWVDDGSTVRLQSSGDKVGIGLSGPSERLVVGTANLGSSIDDEYIVCGNGYYQGYSGLKIGFNSNNFARMKWYGIGEEWSFDTRSLGVQYNNTLVLKKGNVGIGNFDPSEPLSVGDDLGSFAGNRIAVGDNTPGAYTGFMAGEDNNNRAFMTWNIDSDFFGIGIEDGGTQWSNMICLRNGNVGFGTNNPTARFQVSGSGNDDVVLPDGAVSAEEMFNEPGVRATGRTSTFSIRVAWQSLLSTTCNFPSAGYAVVIATAELQYARNDGISDTIEFTIADGSGVGPHAYFKNFGSDDEANSEYFFDAVTIHEFFQVDAGPENFYFMAGSGNNDYNYYITHDARMTVMFFPTAYSSTATYSEQATEPPEAVGEPLVMTTEAGGGGTQALEQRLEALRQTNEVLLQRLEALERAAKE